MVKKIWPVFVLVFLAGCGGKDMRGNEAPQEAGFNADQRPQGKTMVYECDGNEFIALLGPGEMAMWLEGRYIILSQVRSASGVKYEEGDTVFWIKGEEAMLVIDNQQYGGCQLVPGRVPWEDARRRGVDFRAVGNEPGWYLEIQRGRQILFVGDYGMQRVMVPDPQEEQLGPTRSYHAITEANDLRVEIVDGSCTDTMKGDSFPSQVLVYLNGTALPGCGRSLAYPWEK
jgi:membrane-bound inhibitor of C-type lysozyme/uncharacterized membrane protein